MDWEASTLDLLEGRHERFCREEARGDVMLNPGAEVGVRMLVPVVIHRSECVVDLEDGGKRGDAEETEDDRQGSGSRRATQEGIRKVDAHLIGARLYLIETSQCKTRPFRASDGMLQFGCWSRMLIDTHTHLDDPQYDADREDLFERARAAGVETFITIGCDLVTSRAAVALADRYPAVYATVGVHPHEVRHIGDDWYDELRRLAHHPKVIGYGEVGLDYHYNHSPPRLQRERLREQVQLARELRLPLVIHTREAADDTIAILKEERAADVGGVFHCFSGDAALATQALDLGFYVSFSGIVTFANAAALREVVRSVPLDRLLVETDCPYLTPVPYRGKRNEPAYVRLVAEKILELRGEIGSLERLGEVTTANAKRLFQLARDR